MRRSVSRLAIVAASVGLLASCRSASGGLEPRYVAVHNAMTAMGMAQTGAISEGSLGNGDEVRIDVTLEGGQCYTFLSLGGGGVSDMDVRVVGEDGEEVATDATHDRQAAAQACPDDDGAYQVVVRMAEGQGSYLVTSWSGAPVGRRRAGRSRGLGAGGSLSCGEPGELAMGTPVRGNTTGGPTTMQGTCISGGNSPEHIYELEIEQRAIIDIQLESDFDGALYVQRSCGVASSEISCNDDYQDTQHSRIQQTFDPGTYFVVVDGYGTAQGSYVLTAQAQALQSVAQVCVGATQLMPGQTVSGDTSGRPDYFQATCAGGAHSPDDVYRLQVTQPSRVRIRQSSNHDGALHVRTSCDQASSEVLCNDDFGGTRASLIRGTLQPGDYFVYSDGYSSSGPRGGQGASGPYQLTADVTAAAGAGVTGDTCGDAVAIVPGTPTTADTFAARDDLAGSCGGQGSPDVVYTVNATGRSHLTVQVGNPEFEGVIYVRGAQCGNAQGEVACAPLVGGARPAPTPTGASTARVGGPPAGPGPSAPAPAIDTMLQRGTYHIIVDGNDAAQWGAAQLDVQLEDTAALDRMCRTAPLLRSGRTTNGTTVGQQDMFHAGCAGQARSPDRVYRLRIVRRSRVTLTMSTTSHDGALYLRSSCQTQTSEVACNDDFQGQRQSRIEQVLDPGMYYVYADGFSANNAGDYSIQVDVSRP